MYNLLISFAVWIVIAAGVRLLGFPLLAGIIPGFLAFATTFILLGRRLQKRITALGEAVKKELSTMSGNQREQKVQLEKAVKILEDGLRYSKWQFLVGPSLHSQIASSSTSSRTTTAPSNTSARATRATTSARPWRAPSGSSARTPRR